MEKYLPNQSIVASAFDPLGILASLSCALLGTHPPAAWVESCEISLYLRRERKGQPARLFLSALEDKHGWTGRISSGHVAVPPAAAVAASSAVLSHFLHPRFFSTHSSRVRLADFGIVSTSNTARLRGVDKLLEWVFSSPSLSSTEPQTHSWDPSASGHLHKTLSPFFCHLQGSRDIFSHCKLPRVALIQSLHPSGNLLCSPRLLQRPFLPPMPQKPHLCCAWSSPSKVSFPMVSPCTRASLWAWHIDFPIRLVQRAH